MNTCRCGDGFIQAKKSGTLKVINNVTTWQGTGDDNWYYELTYECGKCRGLWIIDAHTENGEDIEEAREFRQSGDSSYSTGKATVPADKFTGTWTDNNGVTLVIYNSSEKLKADYSRRVTGPDNKKEIFTKKGLPAKQEGDMLVIEPGIPGLGPTLELAYMVKDGRDVLIPGTGLGLYDDYADDLGMPWLFPLKIFEKSG